MTPTTSALQMSLESGEEPISSLQRARFARRLARIRSVAGSLHMGRFFLTVASVALGACTTMAPAPMFSDVPTVALCGLSANREPYEGMLVRVQGRYRATLEGSFRSLPGCRTSVWVEFDRSFEANSDARVFHHFEQILSSRSSDTMSGDHAAKVTFVGRFDGKLRKPEVLPGKVVELGYGHLGGWDAQLTVLAIERVAPVAF
jgi:hypothetical protein